MVNRDEWLDAQIGVLGSVLIEPELAPRLICDTGPGDYSGDCRAVYGAVVALVQAGEPVDAMTIRNRLGPASAELLRQIVTMTPTAANYEAYVRATKEQSRLRTLHSMAAELSGAVTLEEARGILSRMQGISVENNANRVTTMMEAMSNFYRRDKVRDYIEFGLPALDDKVHVAGGDVMVLGGYASDGKSAFMLQAAMEISKKHKVGIFSFEGSEAKTTDRIVSHESTVKLGAIRHGGLDEAAWKLINAKAPAIASRNQDIIEASGMTVADVIGLTLSRGYEVIFLDYVQEIHPTTYRRGGTRQEELAEISRALAVMSRQHKILVVELSQLSRPPRNKDGSFPAPTLNSLRESGQLEQDADVVLLLYRTQNGVQNAPRELFVAKNKEGELGRIALRFDGSIQTFSRSTFDEINRLARKGKREAMAGQHSLDGLDEPGKDNPFEGGGA